MRSHKLNLILTSVVFIVILLSFQIKWIYLSSLPWEPLSYFQSFCFISLICVFGINLFNKAFRITLIDLAVILYLGYILLNKSFRNDNVFYDETVYNQLAFLAYFVIVRISLKHISINLIIHLLIFFGLCNLILGGFQMLGFASLVSNDFKVTGFFENPGPFAGFMVAIAPLTLLIFPNKTNVLARIFKIGLYICFISIVVYSESRAGIFSLIMINSVGLIYYLVKDCIMKTKILAIGGLIIFCIISITLLYHFKPDSADGRLLIWKVSAPMINNNPLFGGASGFFNAQYPIYQAKYFASGLGTEREKFLSGSVHTAFNEYLGILIEQGLVGLCLFASLILAIIFTKAKIMHNKTNAYLIASIFAVLIFGLFSYPFHIVPISIIFFTVVAMLSEKTCSLKRAKITSMTKFFSLSVLVVFFSFLILKISSYNKAKALWTLAQEIGEHNPGRSLQLYESAKLDLQNDGQFFYNYGAQLADLGYYYDALKIFQKLSEVQVNINIFSQLGRCNEILGRFDQAEHFYKMAVFSRPLLLNPKLLLFNLYKKLGKKELAVQQAEIILDTPVKIPTAEARRIRFNMRLYLLTNQPS